MGAEIEVVPKGEEGGEPIGSIRRSRPGLRATEVGGAEVPLAIDELPLLALAACFAEGTTRIRDAGELRRKESDRIATVAETLNALGGRVETTEDGMVIEGGGGLRGGAIESHGDHRIAMLGAVAGLASGEGVEVGGMDAAAVSYPGFEADLASLSGVRPPRRLRERQRLRRHGDRDRRARRGRQVLRGPRRRRRPRLHLPRLRGDVPLRGAGGDRAAAPTSMTRRRWGRWPRALEIGLDGERVELDGRQVSDAIRAPEVTEAASRVAALHPGARGDGQRAAAADRRR